MPARARLRSRERIVAGLLTSLVGLTGALLGAAAWSPPAQASEPMNACGCYRDDKGVCKCSRKSKCGCPEECEPVGCEDKRQREADKAANAELQRIAARERKKAAEASQVAKGQAEERRKKPRPKKVDARLIDKMLEQPRAR